MATIHLAPAANVDPIFGRALAGQASWAEVIRAICPDLKDDHVDEAVKRLEEPLSALKKPAPGNRGGEARNTRLSHTFGISDAYRATESVLRDLEFDVMTPFPSPPKPVMPPLMRPRTGADVANEPKQAWENTSRERPTSPDPLTMLGEEERRLIEEHRAKRTQPLALPIQTTQAGGEPGAVQQLLGQDDKAGERAAGAAEERREHGGAAVTTDRTAPAKTTVNPKQK